MKAYTARWGPNMRGVTLGAAFAALLMFVLIDSKDAAAQDASVAAVTPASYRGSGLYDGGHLGYEILGLRTASLVP